MYSGNERKSLTNECAQQTDDRREIAPTKQQIQSFTREHTHTHIFRGEFRLWFYVCCAASLCMWSLKENSQINRRKSTQMKNGLVLDSFLFYFFGVGFSLILIYIWWNIENCKWYMQSCKRRLRRYPMHLYQLNLHFVVRSWLYHMRV